MARDAFHALKEHIDNIWLVDTHEHLTMEEDWLAADEGLVDFSRLFVHYACVDIVSAGMPQADMDKMRSADIGLDEKWAMFEPYWEKAKNTAYCKTVDEAIKDLFGLPGLNRKTYKPLAAKMRKMRKPGYYRHVLKDKARIAKSVLNAGIDRPDPEFFVAVASFDHFVMLRTRNDLHNLERESETSIHSLDDLVTALGKALEKKIELGIVGVKSPIAYCRTLDFGHPAKPDAEIAFNHILTDRGFYREDGAHGICSREGKPLQDYMYHKLIQACIDHKMPMQIHTGVQEGNGNYLAQSNPVLLNNIFMQYPEGRFDIFHAGYPYWAELGVMAKMFPGVHADLCWTNIISPGAARRALDEWLEVMPASKIFAFGGDYIFVEGAYAHAKWARYNVAKVLADKVDDGYFTLDEAKRVAEMVLRENAKEFFGLDL